VISFVILVYTAVILAAGFWLGAKFHTAEELLARTGGWLAAKAQQFSAWVASLAAKKPPGTN
jgi:hypothetical protein